MSDPGRSSAAASFPIVTLGASAGGLEALQSFFAAMPADSGAAFVVVVHLDPDHVSLLPDLIRRKTAMEVAQIEDGMDVRPDRVHIVPPDRELTILGGVLHLTPRAHPGGFHLPIDSFLRSLAQDQGSNAACIILSGTGSDGTSGARAIKGEAGLVMVQDQESARFDGMPRSVLATGVADYVLAPDAMPRQLLEYLSRATTRGRAGRALPVADSGGGVEGVLRTLRARTGHDFSEYKVATVTRRIQRRMDVHQIEDPSDYTQFLKRSPREADLLFKELLIGVTRFFRDPQAFEALRRVALPRLFENGARDSPFRAWVPGCSTGEEAYSLAMLCQEYQEEAGSIRSVKIFATDLNEDALSVARRGRFPDGVASDLGVARIRQFFTEGPSGGYAISREIRDTLVFAPQNLLTDPPFSSMDLISCRNVLIYLSPRAQRRLMGLFHYALKPRGMLFLGTSETTGIEEEHFEVVDREWKIFRRRPGKAQGRQLPLTRSRPPDPVPSTPDAHPVYSAEKEANFMELLEAILKRSDHPPSVVLDEEDQVVYVHGKTGRFLELASGQANLHVRGLVRHGLGTAVQSALRKAASTKKDVRVDDLRARHEGGSTRLDLTVRPVLEPGPFRHFMIVSFLERPEREGVAESAKLSVGQLREELELTVLDLQAALGDLETTNEELQSANEEHQSANEELQSANEELETSKEELQSLHEEAETVNAELQARVEELGAANDDLKNLLDSTQIATIFLDIDLCVRRFTPTATALIPLTDTDLGRPISDIAAHLGEIDLSKAAKEVLDTLQATEAAVATPVGVKYVMRASPYRTIENVIDGVVLTFQEV